ncbi:DUF3515 domain-containing protein [Streptomyces roseoverticillatus]|uniref:DUF3515 domain-containing protein n=1 Tax=Streptomyces roseoverticillatus TaxID=66429 RepID=UPI001F1D051A|nr:DUF3515 domain-containing protein [Streptomyces roseoverticillatus]MCF3106437.1 DUF3515 domain-containing protein [Streptomyces roseoverticillatus]
MKTWPRRLRALPAVAVLLAVAGSASTSGAAARAVPRPPARQAAYCRALHAELPATVAGLERGTSRPVSEFTAQWGAPAVVLRCGVPKPEALTEGTKSFDPYAPAWDIGGIEWFAEPRSDGSVRFLATHRAAWVEVTLPKEYAGGGGGTDILAGIAARITKTIPEGYV